MPAGRPGTYSATKKISVFSTDAPSSSKGGSCFSADDAVTVPGGGQKRLADVALGDEVLTLSSESRLEFRPVLSLPHARGNTVPAAFIELQTAGGRRVRMTSDHLVAAMDCQAAAAAGPLTAGHVGKHLVMAGSLGQQQGGGKMTNGSSSSMCVVSAGPGGELSADEVVGTRLVPGQGIYTAVTSNPFLVSAGRSVAEPIP